MQMHPKTLSVKVSKAHHLHANLWPINMNDVGILVLNLACDEGYFKPEPGNQFCEEW